MRHLAAAALIATLPLTAFAQEAEEDNGFSLMEEGAKLFMRGLMTEVEPALNDMQKMFEDLGPDLQALMAEMGPALRDMLDVVDDLKFYEAPEVLPNGDIILRRKKDAPPLDVPPGGEVEL